MNSREELDKERQELLTKISQLEDQTIRGNGDTTRLQELHDQYNHIMDQEDNLQPPVLPDPCKVLPFELWEDIIRDSLYGASSEDGPNPNNWIVDKLLILTEVSNYWERSLISSPSFWTNITILPDTEDAAIKVAICLYLSAALPLDLCFKIPMSQEVWDILGPMVAAASSRIRSMTFFGEFIDSNGRFTFPRIGVNTILGSFGDLSSLESFTSSVIGDDNIDLDLILVQAQNIRSLSGVKLPDHTVECASLSTIRSIETPEAIVAVYPMLQKYGSLTKVTFSAAQTGSSSITQLAEDERIFNRQSLPWSFLRISQGIVEKIDPLLRRISSTIVELRITISWDMLPQFLVTCSEIRKLECLGLTFPCPYAFHFKALPDCPVIASLHTLDLMLGDHSLNQRASPSGKSEENVGSDDCLFDTLTTWAPFVKNLRVWTCTSRASCIVYAESLHNLETFFVRSWVSGTDPAREIKLPALKELELLGYDSLLASLNCPSLLKIITSLSANSSSFDINESLRLKPEPWRSLRSVELNELKWVWWNVPLPNLEMITVDNPVHLVQLLAQHPTDFPSLNHLRMRSFPNWDILFIMLERRNFQTAEGISMIRTLALPSLPSATILRPLTDRLRGRFSPRPSNFELSLDSIGPMCLDVSLLGCGSCHRALTFCSRSPKELFSPAFDDHVERPKLPPYPNTINEILTTHTTRHEAWQAAIDSSGRTRIKSCGLRSTPGMKEITGCTDTGLRENSV